MKAKLKLKEGLPKDAAARQQQLLQAFHPDKEHDPERKKVLSDAFRIFNALKFRVRDEWLTPTLRGPGPYD